MNQEEPQSSDAMSGNSESSKPVSAKWLCLLLTLVLAAELGARVFVFAIASPETVAKFAPSTLAAERLMELNGVRYVPHHYLGYVPGPTFEQGTDRHNRHGFRGDDFPLAKPEDEFRICCLGGSATYGTAVSDHRAAYPSRLERGLRESGLANVRVINGGVGGWTSWESSLDFELRIVETEPDLVIYRCDYGDVLARCVWPTNRYQPDNSGYRRPKLPLSERPDHPTSFAWRMFRNGVFGSEVVKRHEEHLLRPAPSFLLTDLPEASMTRQTEVLNYTRLALATNSPVYFRENVKNLVVLAGLQGAAVVLISSSGESVPQQLAGIEREARQALDQQNAVLKHIAAKTEARFFDAAKARHRDETDLIRDLASFLESQDLLSTHHSLQ